MAPSSRPVAAFFMPGAPPPPLPLPTAQTELFMGSQCPVKVIAREELVPSSKNRHNRYSPYVWIIIWFPAYAHIIMTAKGRLHPSQEACAHRQSKVRDPSAVRV